MNPRVVIFTRFLLAFAVAGFAACEPSPQAPAPPVNAKPISVTPGPGEAGGKPTPKPGNWMFDKYKNPLEQKPGKTPKKP